MKTEF